MPDSLQPKSQYIGAWLAESSRKLKRAIIVFEPHKEQDLRMRFLTLEQPVIAVAQKSPCEGNRVVMGKTAPLKLGQRGQDAGQETG